ncbi:anthranilate synthase component 2 [Clostridium saccharoperbutylacetonicum]|jgi:anthranilate synthase component 2|uniref:Para-aminobenzoate synthase glutamine amidotransferase component II n=1 Tax=Clostridium saccharoperbutylacetonicum N1-4(HMT) TaxID=931276 RepID=M1MQ10_9CLOT|nr:MULTISPECIES: aminodeoxychorismate/anthranilate synthase component II [Clostridium]AGF56811.1 para-aminobenzoate synthase glutamine amidotransferase component II [Clostridium saccharoperbutylacetonicum N1-4(HMT)]NRT62432.1 anthranilate synthase component 2 [Clostridium saccharoperbutylacetonicum]NSB25773.1 anthranilate synthase component 2 [Clostridium saccharoperbutylacetonicum]NSB45138.1 anthranilate synthase component 2 [Clostridium saccharoperbutylacetonicum]
MIILIDNYDSFTFNLYQYLSEYAETKVFRNDEITIDELEKLSPKGIVISPGPGVPEDAGISIEVIQKLGETIPILGICLGHQSIATAYGGKVIRADEIFHGKTSKVQVKGKDIFEGVPRKIDVMRYHSLIVENSSLPNCLEVIAATIEKNDIMAIKHKEFDVFGLQFHPESIYTPKGKHMIGNFVINICKDTLEN